MLPALWVAVHGLLARRFLSVIALSALVTTGLAFALLSATIEKSHATISGDVGQTWNTPFDILVRPTGSRSSLESQQDLIRSNYLGALAGGGISRAQLDAVSRVPGVIVAAPIAVIGVENWQIEGFGITLPLPSADVIQVFRVRFYETAEAGLSTYPIETHYLVLSGAGHVEVDPRTLSQRLITSHASMGCQYPVSCFAPISCFGDSCEGQVDARYGVELLQPILVAGIDPVAEAKLFGISSCLTVGRYFLASDQPHVKQEDPPGTAVPALISNGSFVDEELHAQLDAAGAGPNVMNGISPADLGSWHATDEVHTSVAERYRSYLPRVGTEVDDWPIWTTSDVAFTTIGPNALQPQVVEPKPEVYERNTFTLVGYPKDWLVPPAARDTWFRSVTAHLPTTEAANRYWDPIGQYDPTCLPGFATLAGGNGLDGYATPTITTQAGKILLPTRSLGGYVNSPPLVLINLTSAEWFSGTSLFTNMPGDRFISAIRIKTDVGRQPTTSAQGRLASIAETIRSATGLDVDIVKGASARPISISLPAGIGGRPALTATEMWSVKGAAVRVQQLVDTDTVFLILLSLAATGLAVGETAYVGLRRRRFEFATLRSLGWPTHFIFRVVASEIVLLGLIACAIALASTLMLDKVYALRLELGTFAILPPLLMGVAFIGGVVPVVSSGYGPAARRLSDSDLRIPKRQVRHSRSIAWRDLLVTGRIETLVSTVSIGVGGATLGIAVLSIRSASIELGSSLLDLSARQSLRGLQEGLTLIVVLFALLGASAVFTTSFLNRLPHYATLRAMGWPRSTIVVGLLLQAGFVAALGAVAGAAIVLAAEFGRVDAASLALGLAGVALVALLSLVPTSFIPILLIYRRSIASLLGGS